MSEENAALVGRLVEILGPGAPRELLDVITHSEEDRAALSGRLSQTDAEFAWKVRGAGKK